MDYFSQLRNGYSQLEKSHTIPNTQYSSKVKYIVIDISNISSFVIDNLLSMTCVNRTIDEFFKEAIDIIADDCFIPTDVELLALEQSICDEAMALSSAQSYQEAQTYASVMGGFVAAMCTHLKRARIGEEVWHKLNYYAFRNHRLFLTKTEDGSYE